MGHLKPRKAATRNGKAVNDVPKDGEYIWWIGKDGTRGQGNFIPLLAPLVTGHNESAIYRVIDWSDISLWFQPPTFNLDSDGNVDLKF